VHIEGERRFRARPEEVYRALTDPDELVAAFPAIEQVDVEGDDWTVNVRPPFPGGFRLRFSVHLEELHEPKHARLRAWGKSLAGRVSVDSRFDLAPVRGGTQMRWSADIDAAGLVSGLGIQSLGAVAKRQADRALSQLARDVERAPTT
jgi:carbon monoxide dehydrogenase subunit G